MNKEKIVLVNDLSPGDVLIMTTAIRAMVKAYPGRFEVDVRSPCQEIFQHSPYITPIAAKDKKAEREAIEKLKKNENLPPIELEDINGDKVKYIISHYPEIHRSGMSGLPFVDGHRMFLEKQMNLPLPRTGMKPDIFLSKEELSRPKMVEGPYWIINAGIKDDYTLKYYAHYQEVVDILKDEIQFVQVGHVAHTHPPLNNVIDLRGLTSLRGLFILSHYAEGAVCCVTMQMVIMAALGKPCVVIAGAREGVRWQLNPEHQFLYRNGVMKCAPYDGCWRSKKEQCDFKAENDEPMCLELITPEEVARSVRLYYLGGRLKNDEIKVENTVKLPKNAVKLAEKEKIVPKTDEIERIKAKKPNILNLDKSEIEGVEDAEIVDKKNGSSLGPDVFFRGSDIQATYTAMIMNTLRILKKCNPDNGYLESYYWHYGKRRDQFMDLYHFLWWLGANIPPTRILEIGTRAGDSICQLLSAIMYYDKIQKIVLCDNFSEFGSPEEVLKCLDYLNIPTDKVEFLVGDSTTEIPKLKETGAMFDYILVDGCHDKAYALADLNNVKDVVDKNGRILFDDLTADGCSLQDVWDQFKNENKDVFKFTENHNGKGLGIAQKL